MLTNKQPTIGLLDIWGTILVCQSCFFFHFFHSHSCFYPFTSIHLSSFFLVDIVFSIYCLTSILNIAHSLILILILTYSSHDEPTLITGLAGKQVIQISCGSTHSAAVTSEGELYTWEEAIMDALVMVNKSLVDYQVRGFNDI